MKLDLTKLADLSNSIIYDLDQYIQTEDKPIYHYTSPSGFEGIIKNGKLRFTDRNFLNDKSEGRYILELCIENAGEIIDFDNEFRNVFINGCKKQLGVLQRAGFFVYQCSFSVEPDNLSLWNYYTKGDSIKGYNLMFDSNNICNQLHMKSNQEDGSTPKAYLGKVIYDVNKQKCVISKIVRKFYDFYNNYKNPNYLKFIIEVMIDRLMFVGCYFKKDCFKIENEYRIVYHQYVNEEGKFEAIKDKPSFYEKNGFFIPCLDVSFEPKALLGITISPTLDFSTTQYSLLRIIGNYNLTAENIVQSNIPVRY